MEPNLDVKALLNSIGVLAEIAGFMRDQLTKQGFTREKAVAIVDHYICTMCTGRKS